MIPAGIVAISSIRTGRVSMKGADEWYAGFMNPGKMILVGLILLGAGCTPSVDYNPCGDAGTTSLEFGAAPCQGLSARVLALCGNGDASGPFNGLDPPSACGTIWGPDSACSSRGGTFTCQPDMSACLMLIDDAGTCDALLRSSCGLRCYRMPAG